MNKNIKYSSVFKFFLCISRPRRCLDSQEIRAILSDDSESLSDISGGGDDSTEDKTYIPKKGLLGLSSSSEEDHLVEGNN